MGISQQLDINIVSPENSSSVPLLAAATFSGSFVRVSDYVSFTVYASTDVPPAFDGFQVQWSFDGIVEEVPLRESFGSSDKFLDGRIRAPFLRVVYTNGIADQSFLTLVTILRRGTPVGTILTAGSDVPNFADAQITHAVLNAPSLSTPSDIVQPRASDDPFLYVIPPPNRSTLIQLSVSATTFFSPELDFFGIFAGTRRWLTVFNNTIRGNLYVKLGGSASISAFGYDYIVPPQHLWTLPDDWINMSGTVYGIWDYDADGGEAHIVEAF